MVVLVSDCDREVDQLNPRQRNAARQRSETRDIHERIPNNVVAKQGRDGGWRVGNDRRHVANCLRRCRRRGRGERRRSDGRRGQHRCAVGGRRHYVYVQDWKDYDSNDYAAKWRVSLGPNQPFAPPPPTWREHLRSLGRRLETSEDIERACIEHGLLEEELDAKVKLRGKTDGTTLQGRKRRRFISSRSSISAPPPDSKLKQAGQIIFEEFGGGPGNSYTWVELKDDLTVPFLRARLMELNLADRC